MSWMVGKGGGGEVQRLRERYEGSGHVLDCVKRRSAQVL